MTIKIIYKERMFIDPIASPGRTGGIRAVIPSETTY